MKDKSRETFHKDGYRIARRVDPEGRVALYAVLTIGGEVFSRRKLFGWKSQKGDLGKLIARADRLQPALEAVARYANLNGDLRGEFEAALGRLNDMPRFAVHAHTFITSRRPSGAWEHVWRCDDGSGNYVVVAEGGASEVLSQVELLRVLSEDRDHDWESDDLSFFGL